MTHSEESSIVLVEGIIDFALGFLQGVAGYISICYKMKKEKCSRMDFCVPEIQSWKGKEV